MWEGERVAHARKVLRKLSDISYEWLVVGKRIGSAGRVNLPAVLGIRPTTAP